MSDRWDLRAACVGQPLEVFFPDTNHYRGPGGGDRVWQVWAEARRICRDCPVKAECLAAAMKREQAGTQHRHGMWGGMNPDERERYARGRSLVVGPSDVAGAPTTQPVRGTSSVRTRPRAGVRLNRRGGT